MKDLTQFTGVIWGYARVSTEDQNLDMQIDALTKAGVPEILIHSEKKSGRNMKRPQLDALKRKMAKGDCLVVWKLDRLGRSTKGVLDTIHEFEERGIHFRTIQDNIDTTTPMGKVILTVFAAMAQLESDLASERTKAGMEAARRRGRVAGRKHSVLSCPNRLKRFTELWVAGDIPDGLMSASQVVEELNAVKSKLPPIKSVAVYSNWKSRGFKGFEPPEGKERDDG